MHEDPPCICSDRYREEHSLKPEDFFLNRREFLMKTGMGMGAMALASVLGFNLIPEASAQEPFNILSPLVPRQPHFPAKAKAVIHIFAAGGPSHVDTFDPKPMLSQYDGKTLPGMRGVGFGSPFGFKKYGKSGIEVSDVFSKVAEHVDEMAIIRSMWTDIPAHDVAQRFMHTGSLQVPKPCLGSWVLYGLGSENQNMPGFISMGSDPEARQASFLPGPFQGCEVNFKQKTKPNEVIQNLNSFFASSALQKQQIDFVKKMNDHYQSTAKAHDPQMESRIQSFEMAFKMQTEASDAFDVTKEPENIQEMYGKTDLGAKMLVARRLVERGVRFVQVTAGGWDHHNDLNNKLPESAMQIDQPAAALLKDLKQRGMLDSTLVIWGGEFGRTVVKDQNGNSIPGRDHNGKAFCTWMAGGGVKGGTVYGATDEFGAASVQNKVHVHDLHATILQLLGFDHTKLTYRYNGRDFRLTDNYGEVVKGILA